MLPCGVMKRISVVVPLFNEKDALDQLYAELVEEAERLPYEFEFIFVDDGSSDGSHKVLRRFLRSDSRLQVIRFRRNFGKSAALSAGFSRASGDVIVTLDADLQDKPAEMGKLLKRLEEGYDLVSGWKRIRRDPITKRWPSRLFNFATSVLTGVPLHDINCGFKAYRREVINEVRVYGEMHRYIPVLASYRGFRVGEVPVEHRSRVHGVSKFGAGRFVGGFFDLLTVIMLTRYNSKPLHIFGVLGVLSLLAGFVIELYLSVGWLLGRPISDRPLFFLGIVLLLVGVQFIFFGLLAEMIAYSARRQEEYSIQERLGSDPDAGHPQA